MADSPFITFTSDYEYSRTDTDEFGKIIGRAITFQMDLSNMRVGALHSRIDEMAYLLKDTARSFVSAFIHSGNLYENIDVIYGRDYKGGIRLELGSFATNQDGQYYGGHIEYGYHPWGNDKFIPARPYMRPAMEIVANSSGTDLASAIGEAFNDYIVGNTLTNTIISGNRWHKAMTKSDRNTWMGLKNNLAQPKRVEKYNSFMRSKYSIDRYGKSKTNPSNWNSKGQATSKTYMFRGSTIHGLKTDKHPLSK